MPDAVDNILAQWAQVRPDLDVSPMGVIGRLHRLAARLDGELATVFTEHGLAEGEFDVLATLRRAGEPYALTPGELVATAMVTSGAITKRVDRLVAAGLVAKQVAENDARSRVVTLTAAGLALVDRVLEVHLANERRLLAGLSESDRVRLIALLRRWNDALDAAQ